MKLFSSFFYTIIVGLLCCTTLSAQHFEFGALLGMSIYEGDLSKTTTKGRIEEMNLAGGILVRYNFNDFIGIRGSFNYGKLTGADDEKRADRNLNFSSNIYEFGVMGEINILGYQPYALQRVFSPYIFGGIAAFKFNPTTFYNGQTVELQPLGTEGQGLSQYPERSFYNLIQVSIPVGIGVKYALNDKWNIGLETGLRITFTDYIDDVSMTYPGVGVMAERGEVAAALSDRAEVIHEAGARRGNPGVKDMYIFSGIIISHNFLDNGLVGTRRKSRRKTGCPSAF